MILKGNQRAGGDDLASHLMNLYDNDEMELAEIRGTLAQDLHGALAEFEAHAAGTRCKQPLYSLSINPSEPMTREQYFSAIGRIEDRLGLPGSRGPSCFMSKTAGEHCHVVWSRIDTEKMRAVQLSHDHQKLRVRGAGAGGRNSATSCPTALPATAAASGSGGQSSTCASWPRRTAADLPADQRRAAITAAFRQSDSAQAFVMRCGSAVIGSHRATSAALSLSIVPGTSTASPGRSTGRGPRISRPSWRRCTPRSADREGNAQADRGRARGRNAGREGRPHLRRSPDQLKARQAERRAA